MGIALRNPILTRIVYTRNIRVRIIRCPAIFYKSKGKIPDQARLSSHVLRASHSALKKRRKIKVFVLQINIQSEIPFGERRFKTDTIQRIYFAISVKVLKDHISRAGT